MGSLLDKVNAEQKAELNTDKEKQDTTNEVIGSLKSKNTGHGKNKLISALVDSDNWEKFKIINEKRATSNSKMLNLMIADYVLEHQSLLN